MIKTRSPNLNEVRGQLTLGEIRQQPELWMTTLERVRRHPLSFQVAGLTGIICGAGTSAYAASAVARCWAGAHAIPTTDLLVSSKEEVLRLVPEAHSGLLVSLARSGESPESRAVVTRMQKMFPALKQLAITCNQHGRLAQLPEVEAIVLDARTNDRSLAMTSSFSNLVLGGIALRHPDDLAAQLPTISERVEQSLQELEAIARDLASHTADRFVVLTPAELAPLAREACLKMLEMTAGRVTSVAETFLGLRHGPMSYLREDTLVLCVLSTDPHKRRYEEDLLIELKRKKLGRLVVLMQPGTPVELGHVAVPAMVADMPDYLRTPFEIVFPQLLAYHVSLASNLDPDNPSPQGVITRVVETFDLHESNA